MTTIPSIGSAFEISGYKNVNCTGDPMKDAKNFADANNISIDEAKKLLSAKYGAPNANSTSSNEVASVVTSISEDSEENVVVVDSNKSATSSTATNSTNATTTTTNSTATNSTNATTATTTTTYSSSYSDKETKALDVVKDTHRKWNVAIICSGWTSSWTCVAYTEYQKALSKAWALGLSSAEITDYIGEEGSD